MEPTRLSFAPGDTQHIAVVLQASTEYPFNTHSGVLYRTGGAVRHLHLCWHRFILDCEPVGHLAIAKIDIHVERARFFPRLCSRIAARYSVGKPKNIEEANKLIPYGLQHPNAASFVSETGEAINFEDGLNCCSFVIVLFATYGVTIVNPMQWPKRDSDIEWHKYLVKKLADQDPAHAAKVREHIGCQRVRPQELAGACLCSNMPIWFSEADFASRYLMQYVNTDPSNCSFL